MTDQDLVKACAHAFGIDVQGNTDPEGVIWVKWPLEVFNPLQNDAQALRLAVHLKLDLHFEDQWCQGELIPVVEAMTPRDEYGRCICPMRSLDHDQMASVRRVIVEAAATLATDAR